MPCLIIAGHPSAGKTTLAKLLKERALLHDAIDEVVIVNEESECGCVENDDETKDAGKVVTTKQELYKTSYTEKQTRGALKAAFDRAVKKTGNKTRKRLVILDSMNYIKGFRYELHCISKASGEKHGILWVLNRVSVVQEWNQNYSPELLHELISRFEPPDERNRWDKPLFTVDVAPKLDSNQEETAATTKTKASSKNEVLENSVYNMHALGEAFGTQAENNNATTTTAAAAAPTPQKPTKSAFSRKGPKKSAFSRRKKLSSEKDTSKIVPGPENSNNNKIIFDTSILTSQNDDANTDSKSSTPNAPAPKPKEEEEVNTKSLEEQLDDILHTFLVQTQNLKEGMSTRTYG